MLRWARLGALCGVLVLVAASCGGTARTPGRGPAVSLPGAAPQPPAPGQPRPESDPAGLASQLTVTEALVRDPATNPAYLPWLGWLQQVDYTQAIAHPEWEQALRQQLPVWLQQPAAEIVDAGRQLASLSEQSPLPTRLPSWRIVAPAPASQLLADYHAASAATGVPWEYLAAINLIESYMGRIRGTSTAGAQGPMQFLPSTWSSYGQGGDINSDHDAIMAAARLLRASGAPSHMATAISRYNPSSHYVAAVTDYARVMQADARSYIGFYWWQVYFRTSSGDVLLPIGYGG